MKLSVAIASTVMVLGLAFGPAAKAVPITFDFVPTSIEGGGTFTAYVTYESTLLGNGLLDPLDFLATLTDNSVTENHVWDLTEVFPGSSNVQYDGVTFIVNSLLAFDFEIASNDFLLLIDPTGVIEPVRIEGFWTLRSTDTVPENTPALAFPAVLAAMGIFARCLHKSRR